MPIVPNNSKNKALRAVPLITLVKSEKQIQPRQVSVGHNIIYRPL